MSVLVGRSLARAAGLGVVAGVATAAGPIVYVGRLDLPEHPDLDASGRVGRPDRPVLDVVVVGDSSCTGPGLHDPRDIWLNQVLGRFGDQAFTVASYAVGGAQTTDVITDQLPAATARRRDLALVSIGTNDALHGRSPVGVHDRLAHIVDALLERSGAVMLLGVGDVGTAPRIPFPLSAVATTVAHTVDRVHARVARPRARVFKAPMWELTTASFRRRDDVWSTDRFHPNADGHALWADGAEPAVAAALDHLTAPTTVGGYPHPPTGGSSRLTTWPG